MESIDVRIDGETPDTLPLDELVGFLSAVSGISVTLAEGSGDAHSPGAETPSFCLVAVEENCVSLRLKANAMAMAGITAMVGLALSDTPFPSRCRDHVNAINRFSSQPGRAASFSVPGQAPLRLSVDRRLTTVDNHVTRQQVTVFGTLYDVGGKTPNAHIGRIDGADLICRLPKGGEDHIEMARRLGSQLYSTVGFRGEGKFVDGVLREVEVNTILPYRMPTANPVREVAESRFARFFTGMAAELEEREREEREDG